MKKMFREVINELLLVFSGRSLDLLLPPILFIILYRFGSIQTALIGSLLLAILFFIHRVIRRDNITYSVFGLIGVVFATVMVYINQNASDFFLPDIIGTFTLIVGTIVSLILKRPLAMLVSHITRGWELEWFHLPVVKPAYTEVTYFWLGFFVLRFIIEIYLYQFSSVEDLVIANIILGFPITILVLTISYIYGIWRLHQLGGPGVEEFRNKVSPPYKGQTRGF